MKTENRRKRKLERIIEIGRKIEGTKNEGRTFKISKEINLKKLI